jgi:secreted trypsin-like serine protease
MKFRLFALVPIALTACVQPPSATVGEAPQAIVGGTSDTTDGSVVLVVYEQGQSASLCTGEVISPHVVLTAAHCVDPAVIGTGGTFHVYTGNNINSATPTQLLAVKETHFNPAFDVNNLQGGNDIAVVIVQNPLTLTPLKMNRTPVDQTMVGQAVRLVGYGVTSGTDTTGTSAGIRRQTSTTLGGFDDVLVNFDDPAHITCEGDSGGPAFMTLKGEEVIVGITSFGDRGCMQAGFDTRVDKFADSFVQPWIDMFDPLPPDMTVGADGFPPGAVGATCSDNTQCTSHTCAHQGDVGFCTTTCDPMNMNACPMGTHCGEIDSAHYCVRDSRDSGGCTFGDGETASAAALLLLSAALLFLVFRRRNS